MADMSAFLFGSTPRQPATDVTRGGGADAATIRQQIRAEAQRQGVDPALALAVARQESRLDPHAVGDNGKSLGLFQLQRAAAIEAGIDPARRGNPALNIEGGVRYLKQKLQQSGGNVEQALSRYNRGTPTYRGIGDPRYVENVLAKMEGGAPRQGLLQRVGRAISPASAEAASMSPAAGRDLSQELFGATPAAAPPAPAAAPPPVPAPSPAPGAPIADPGAAPDYRQYIPVSPVEATAEANKSKPWWKPGAGMGISTTMAILGRGTGAMVAPLTGPFAPAMPLAGEMAFSYLGRKLNVALGLEEPGTLGDVASVAMPGITGTSQTAQAFRNAPAAAPVRPSKAVPMLQAAEEAKIPLTYGEATGKPLVKRAEEQLEKVPGIGTGGFRERQHTAAKAAADETVRIQQQAMRDTPWANMTQLKAAAATGSKQAQRLVDEITQAGDDMGRVVQASGNLQAWRVRQVASRLYDRVGELAEGLGNVPTTKTLATIDDTLKELRTAVVPDTETIRYLEQLKSGLQGQTSTTISPLLDASGNPITRTVTTPGKTTYGQLRQLRSDLGDTISDYYQGSNAVIGAKGVGNLTKVKGALEQDLDTFALHSPNPELREAAKRADTHYKNKVVPFEDRQLATALQSNTPDEIYSKFIQRGHGDRAKNFYNALDPKGKAAVQYGMVAEAQHKALDPTTGNFSPAKFEGSLKAIQEARGVFFTGEAAAKLDGLMKVMRAAERAGQFKENPPTGQRAVPWLMAGGLGSLARANPLMAGGAVAATKALSWVLTSRHGTALLLRAHGVGEQSLAMDNVLQQLTTQAARVMATEAGEGLQEGRQIQVEPGRVGR